MLNGLGGVGVTVGVTDGDGLGVAVGTDVEDGARVDVGNATVGGGRVFFCVAGTLVAERQPETRSTVTRNNSDEATRLCIIQANDTINHRFGLLRGLDSDER
jgi:hypothetical protein